MRTLTGHIENARMQPMHIRKQIAFTTAFVGTALVAVFWLGINLATGSFALNTNSFEAANVAAANASQPAKASNTSLLGSVAAAFSGPSTPAHVDVVNAGTNSSVNAPAVAPVPERTVIPF